MSTSKATFRIRRRPSTLEPTDHAALLADLHHRIAASWSISAALPPFARFFGAGWEEEVSLATLLDEGEDEKVAAILLRAAGRPEVRAAFREGEGWVWRGEQKLRVVALLEIRDVESLAWTLHLQRVGEGEAGCGVYNGEPWTDEGVGLDALPEPFREWLDRGMVAVADFGVRQLPAHPPRSVVRAGVGTLPFTPERTAEALADLVGRLTDREVMAGRLDWLTVFALRGQDLERWELSGDLPCTLDDLLRNIALQSKADGLALVHPATLQVNDGVTRRAVSVTAERAGRLAQRALALDLSGEQIKPVGAWMVDVKPVSDNWLGVAPSVEISFTPNAAPMAPKGEA